MIPRKYLLGKDLIPPGLFAGNFSCPDELAGWPRRRLPPLVAAVRWGDFRYENVKSVLGQLREPELVSCHHFRNHLSW